MKTTYLALFGCFAIALSGAAIAYCGGGDCSPCNPYVNACQCTDPYCYSYDRTCISQGTCCEAFGNIGAR